MPQKSIITGQHITSAKAQRTRELRREMTPAERLLWAQLRANRLQGFHFRRQQIIEPFIVDFYCHQANLVIEVDGDVHAGQQDYDRQREEQLQAHGLHVLRFTNREVVNQLDEVLQTILTTCSQAAAGEPVNCEHPDGTN
jgi:very-short-patch-repair endonuclease